MKLEVAWRLTLTGIGMGIVHVLSGPDHLSALATLSVGSSWKAFFLGVRWGLGHSTGLMIVAVIFLSLDGELDLETIGSYLDYVVGVFMILLGIYGLYSAKANSKELYDQAKEIEKVPIDNEDELDLLMEHHHNHNHSFAVNTEDDEEHQPGDDRSMANHQEPVLICRCINMRDPCTQKIVAFSIGIVHGIAGPGGILGVLPAVELHSWSKSMLYLGCFCLSSTLCMGVFAALYGEGTRRFGGQNQNTIYYLSIFSACLSLIVGILWIVLDFFGILGEIFP